MTPTSHETDAPAADAGHASAAPQGPEQAPAHPRPRKGHGGGHGAGGHGHGGTWLVTYCDMITLLIAFFICIMTFASQENGKEHHRKLHDSLLYGEGGSGIAGPAHAGPDQDAVVWRQLLLTADLRHSGSRTPPLYSDPALGPTRQVLNLLEQAGNEAVLPEGYALRLPLSLLFGPDRKLTPSGSRLLGVIARNVRWLPYDLLLQVEDAGELSQALAAVGDLTRRHGLAASRVGVGIGAPGPARDASLCLLLQPRPQVRP
jgi:chemotaxis protein MotB